MNSDCFYVIRLWAILILFLYGYIYSAMNLDYIPNQEKSKH